jgi:hypothetical protein
MHQAVEQGCMKSVAVHTAEMPTWTSCRQGLKIHKKYLLAATQQM